MLAPAESGIGYFFGSLTMSASADSAMVDYGEPTFDSEGVSKSSVQCTTVTSSTKFTGGWYYVGSDVKFGEVKVTGDTKIILGAGKTMKCTDGIVVLKGNSLTIYNEFKRDSNGDIINGTLDTYSKTGPGIGGNNGNVGGDITINGGIIKAKSDQCAGIGGGRNGSGIGDIKINYGTVTATGGTYCPGIGTSYGNKSCGTITISGGTVTATGGTGGAGIGTAAVVPDSDNMAEGSFTVNITGGTVTAKGGSKGAGIGTGCGREKNSDPKTVPYACTVNISGGYTNVTAIGGDWGAGIGGGKLAKGGTVTISDGIVIAKGGYQAAGIGGGSNALKRTSGGTGNGGNVTITGGTVEAYGAFNKSGDGTGAAGIGGGYAGNQGGTVRITYGNVTVKGNKAPAIGGGATGGSAGGSDGTLTFDGSKESEYVKVTVGSEVADKAMRESKCRLKSTEVVISTCTHSKVNYSQLNDEQHSVTCTNCSYTANTAHTTGETCVCGYTQPRYIVFVKCPDGSYNYDVAVGNTVYLPDTGIVKTTAGTDLGYLYERVREWRIKGTNKVIAAGGGYVVSTDDKDAEATGNTITVNPEYTEKYGDVKFAVTGYGSVSAVGGTVEVTNSGENTVTVAKVGDTVTLRVSPDPEYIVSALTATNGTNDVTLTPSGTGEYTFTMPEYPVQISAAFEKQYTLVNGTAPTCTTVGTKDHYTWSDKYYIADDSGELVQVDADYLVIPALGHQYDIVWTWSADHTTATATFTCTMITGFEGDGETFTTCGHSETLDADVTSETVDGVKTYTATATLDGVDYTDEYSEDITPITYIGADGNSATTTDYTIITSDTTSWSGTMVATGKVTIKGAVTLKVNTDLILCDDATLTIDNPISSAAIYGLVRLNIFVQSGKTGKLSAISELNGLYATEINIYGGNITTSNICGNVAVIYGGSITTGGIKSISDDVYIYGGNIYPIEGQGCDITSTYNINLGWTNPTDSIKASYYSGTVNFTKPFVIEDGTLATADNIAGQTLTPAYMVAVYSRTDKSAASVADLTVSPGNTVSYGAEVTVTAPDKQAAGYSFLGWYKATTVTDGAATAYDSTQLCATLAYTFNVSEDINLVAVYKANGTATITVNDEKAETTPYTVEPQLGTAVTITSADTTNILRWENESGKVLGTSGTLTFTAIGNTTVNAVYKAASGQSFVQFVSDFGQVLSYNQYSATSNITFPTVPTKFGYTFDKWVFEGTTDEATEAAIKAKIGTESIITIKPSYTKDTTPVVVTVTYSGVTREADIHNLVKGETVNLTAPVIDGYNFQYWQNASGAILGYKTDYFMMVSETAEITAVYATEAADIKPVIAITDLSAVTEGTLHKISCEATRSVPDGYTLVEQGMLYGINLGSLTGETFVYGTGGVYRYVASDLSRNGVLRVSNKVSDDTTVIYYRAYMLLRNESTGNQEYYYTDIVSRCYNG